MPSKKSKTVSKEKNLSKRKLKGFQVKKYDHLKARAVLPKNKGVILREEYEHAGIDDRLGAYQSNAPVEAVKGVGKKKAWELHLSHIDTVGDLNRYNDNIAGFEENLARRKQEEQGMIDRYKQYIKDIDEEMVEVKKYYELDFKKYPEHKQFYKDKRKEKIALYRKQIATAKLRQKYPYTVIYTWSDERNIEEIEIRPYPIRIGKEYDDFLWQFPSWMIGDIEFDYITQEELDQVSKMSGLEKSGSSVAMFYKVNADYIALPETYYNPILLYHEFGHHVWHKQMSERKQDTFKKYIDRMIKMQMPFLSPYDFVRSVDSDKSSSVNEPTEWFADSFAQYMIDNFEHLKTKIIRTGVDGSLSLSDISTRKTRIQKVISNYETEMLADGMTKRELSNTKKMRKFRKELKTVTKDQDIISERLELLDELGVYYFDLLASKGGADSFG